MRKLIATTALALMLGTPALAQEGEGAAPPEETAPADPAATEPAAEPEALEPDAAPPPEEPEPTVEGAIGLETGAIGETFFIRAPQEFHMLASELAGQPVYIDVSAAGAQAPVVADAEAAGTVDDDIREGVRPAATVVDVLLDRAGQVAALVVELDEDMRGGAREVAVAMGLVRMSADRDDPGQTHLSLQLDPVDLENAPTFERAAEDDEAAGAGAAQPGADEAQGEDAAGE